MGERADTDRIETGTVVIGAGFSGPGMAIQFRMEGRSDFVVLEKADDLGGTWRGNDYPGCGSFEQNPPATT